jgi:adenine-specific DNA-methyltransferase
LNEDGKNKNKIKVKGRFKWQQSFLDEEVEKGTYFLIKSNQFSIRYQRETANNMAPDKLIDDVYLSKSIGVETNEDSKKHIDALNLKFNSYPKPESLISFLIKAVTDEDDIIVDYHLGSGTTSATAHKMQRQYIGIEQMDYIENVAVERLKKVIEGEQGGISKSIDWKGGGSFVYLELKKYNQTFIEQIEEAKDSEGLLTIWEDMKDKSFLNYNVDIKKQDEHMEEFEALSLAEQKQHLCEILDKNQLYVNLSSLNDKDFECTDEEKAITKDFYQIKD